jgi:hypothetical protein
MDNSNKIKNTFKIFINWLLFGLVILIGLKSCLITVISFDELILMEGTFESGEKDRILITPDREAIYTKSLGDINELGIYEIKGEEGTHYLFGLYCIGTFPFGLRYYKNAEKVFDAELIMKYKLGESFPKEGESFRTKIIIFPDKVIMGKHTFKRLPIYEEEKQELYDSIKRIKSAIKTTDP